MLSHPPSGLPWRSDLERLRLTQPLPPSPPLARIRNLSTIPRACTKSTRAPPGHYLRWQTEREYRGINNQKKDVRRPARAPFFPSSPPARTRSSIPARRSPTGKGTAPPSAAAGAGVGETAAAATCPPEREVLESPPRPPPCRLARAASLAAVSRLPAHCGGGGGWSVSASFGDDLYGPDACLWAMWAGCSSLSLRGGAHDGIGDGNPFPFGFESSGRPGAFLSLLLPAPSREQQHGRLLPFLAAHSMLTGAPPLDTLPLVLVQMTMQEPPPFPPTARLPAGAPASHPTARRPGRREASALTSIAIRLDRSNKNPAPATARAP